MYTVLGTIHGVEKNGQFGNRKQFTSIYPSIARKQVARYAAQTS